MKQIERQYLELLQEYFILEILVNLSFTLSNIHIFLLIIIYYCITSIFLLEFSPSQESEDDDVAHLNPNCDVELICQQLGINAVELERCLTSRSFGVRSIVTCLFTVPQVCVYYNFIQIFQLISFQIILLGN